MQRSLWIGGFALGAMLGTIVLRLGSSAPTTTPTTRPPVSYLERDQALATIMPAQFPPVQMPPSPPGAFELLENRVAASQGGRISLGQILAIARITRSQPDAPTFEQLEAHVAAMRGGGLTIGEMLALRGAVTEPAGDGRARMFGPSIGSRTGDEGALPNYVSPMPFEDVRRASDEIADSTFASRAPSASFSSAVTAIPSSSTFSSSNSRGLIDSNSGQYMAPAAGGYIDPRNGTFYAQSGPNGVVNTRTGEFIPTH